MISTRTGRQKLIDGFVICFLAAACAATIALNIGLSLSPGKILPTSISMRTGEMSENIIAGLKNAENEVFGIKNGMDPVDAWNLISDHNLDLFFLIALILPKNLTQAVLTIGYFLRFGAAASLIYWFCCCHTGLRRLYSFLLGMMYALSAQVILTAQFATVMNMVVIIPAALSAFDSYLRERTWKAFGLSCLACAMTAVSGSCGCLSGIPFLAVAALLLSVSLYRLKRQIFSSWLKLLGAVTAGTAMASFTVIPRFIGFTPGFDVVASFKTAEMRYKLYDLLRHTYAAQSGGLDRDMVPVFYIGILTLEAVVLFWANFKIPVRVKVTTAVILSVWYISCASSFVSEAVSIFGESNVLSASRLICLEVFLFFCAAIALRNIDGVTSGALYAAFLVPMAFLVFSGNFYSDIQFSTTINLGTAATMLVCGLIVRHIALETPEKPVGKRFKTVIATIGAAAVTVNASFIMFNNSVSLSDSGVDMIPDNTEMLDGEYIDSGETAGLSVFSEGYRFLLLSEDISSYNASDFADAFNYMSGKAGADACFEKYDITLVYSDQADLVKDDLYKVGSGFSSVTYELNCEDGDRMFVYCGFGGDTTIRNTNGDFEEETDLTKPSLTEIDASEGKHEVAVFFSLDGETESRLAFLRLRQPAADDLERVTHSMEKDGFSFRTKDIPGQRSGTASFVTSMPYDASVKIMVNGRNCKTFNYMGLTGCVFDASESAGEYVVRFTKVVPGLAGGIAVSAAVCLAVIAIPLIYKYTYKNNKKGKGSGGEDPAELPDGNAEQENC